MAHESCNYIHYNVWDEITYPFLNFNGATVEVYEWMSNFIPHFTGHVVILSMLGLKLNHVSKRGNWPLVWISNCTGSLPSSHITLLRARTAIALVYWGIYWHKSLEVYLKLVDHLYLDWCVAEGQYTSNAGLVGSTSPVTSSIPYYSPLIHLERPIM